MRIEHAQHAGDGAVVDGLIGIERLGVVLLHHLVYLGEVAEAVIHVGDACRFGVAANLLPKDGAQKAANQNDGNYEEERAKRAVKRHSLKSPAG